MVEGLRGQLDDSAGSPIEKHVEDMVVALIVAGEMKYRQSEVSHHEWLVDRKAQLIENERRRKEEEERREHERRIIEEQARVDRLLGEAGALRQANDIRSYVEMARKANAVSSDPVCPEALEAWASWALAQADRIDPVLSRKFLEPVLDATD